MHAIHPRADRRDTARASDDEDPEMSSSDTPGFFDFCRARIDELLDHHADMGIVERTIDDANALDREEKDALWLWASERRHRIISGGANRPVIGSTARTDAGEPKDDLRYGEGAGHD